MLLVLVTDGFNSSSGSQYSWEAEFESGFFTNTLTGVMTCKDTLEIVVALTEQKSGSLFFLL